MTKHIGPMIAWIIGAGIALYAFRHIPELLDGVSYLQRSIDAQQLPDAVQWLFK